MGDFNTIKTDRLFIRILEMQDKELFYKYRSMPEIYKHQSWRPKHIKEVEDFIDRNVAVRPNKINAWLQIAICLNKGRIIGDIGIHYMDDYQMEIGFTLSPEYQGNGYAVEAVKGVINYIFFELKKHRVTASVDPNNIKSIKLLEKIGFRKEAYFIKSYRMNGQWLDDCIYALLADEWNLI